VKPSRVSYLPGPLVQQRGEHHAVVVRGAADREIVDGVAPVTPQPLEIRLESPGSDHDRPAAHDLATFAAADDDPLDVPPGHEHILHGRLVVHRHAATPAGLVVRVQQRLAAAQEESVRARQRQRAPQRRLPSGSAREIAIAYGDARFTWVIGPMYVSALGRIESDMTEFAQKADRLQWDGAGRFVIRRITQA
jgi:hypothetical protein